MGTKKKEGIDILDSIGSNIKLDIFNNEIVRILPKLNFNINKEWISNKTRYFFDSLKYQRLKSPLLKDDDGNFNQISWFEAFNLINKQFGTIDSSKIRSIVGNLTDLESIFLLKKNLTKLGIINIEYESLLKNKNLQIDSDLTSNFLFNTPLKSIDESDLCLIIGSNFRDEGAMLNVHLLNRLKKGNFKIAYIGPKTQFLYPVKQLGLTLKTLLQIILGKHTFCKDLKNSKKPLIFIGENLLNQKNGFFLVSKLKNLSIFQNNVNFFNTQTSLINFLEITFSKKKNLSKNSKLYYLFNTNLQNTLPRSKQNFIIYQGHHFTHDAQNSNLILPGLTFLEKTGMYINLEGIIQKNETILNLKTNQRKDSLIYRNIYMFLLKKNQFKYTSFFNMHNILPYLLKKNLQILNNFNFNNKYLTFNINFLDSLIKNKYYTTIFEQYSKILINSNKILKKHSKFL